MINKLDIFLLPLKPVSVLYSILMRIRAFLFKSGLVKSVSFDIPVISIGNLTMGGSGKTPCAIYIADMLLRNGFKPAVISRGYKGKAQSPVNIVSDGQTIFLDSHEAGDEPRMIADSVPGLVVITGKKREEPCQSAINTFACDILILDDGFQHLRVQRDIDLVLFNASSLFMHMNVLPAGYLREPLSALSRSTAVILTGCNSRNSVDVDKFRKFIRARWSHIPIYTSSVSAKYFVDRDGKQYGVESFRVPVFAFCGIANPERFFDSLAVLQIDVIGTHSLSDHQHYTEKILRDIERQAAAGGSTILITTTKDLVKLKKFNTSLALYALQIDISFGASFETFLWEKISMIHSHSSSKREKPR